MLKISQSTYHKKLYIKTWSSSKPLYILSSKCFNSSGDKMFQYSHIVYYQHTILQLLNKNWIYFFFLIFWHAEPPSLLLGYYAAGINSSLNSIFFKSFLPFSNLICLIKKLFWLEKKLIHYAWQKTFLKSY